MSICIGLIIIYVARECFSFLRLNIDYRKEVKE